MSCEMSREILFSLDKKWLLKRKIWIQIERKLKWLNFFIQVFHVKNAQVFHETLKQEKLSISPLFQKGHLGSVVSVAYIENFIFTELCNILCNFTLRVVNIVYIQDRFVRNITFELNGNFV